MVSPSTRQSLPTGTVTFLFTDIEGSTRLVQSLGDDWVPVLEAHNHLIEKAITGNNGVVVKTEGDSFFAVFSAAHDALQASVQAQHGLMDHPWPSEGVVRSRMGLHTGLGALGASDYVGLDVHRAARIADSAHGGQVVLSEPTAVLVERSLPEGVSLRDLGKHRLKDLAEPEAILQVVSPGLQSEFPLLRTLDAIPNNLPKLLTSFVGRDRELAEAVRLLGVTRILTFTGPGGTGKTRLSLQLAAEVADGYPDGCSSSISPRSTMWKSSHRASWRRWAFRSPPGRNHRRCVSTANCPTRASCSSWTTSSSCSTERRSSPSCCEPRHVPRWWSRLGHRFGSAVSKSSRSRLSASPGSIQERI